MATEREEGRRRQPGYRSISMKEVIDQRAEVLAALLQRGKLDGFGAESGQEISAHSAPPPFVIGLCQGGDYPDLDASALHAPERQELAILYEAEQLRLRGRRHVANLVQEQGAALGLFDEAQFAVRRLRVSATRVSKQLALDELGRQGRTVEGLPTSSPSRTRCPASGWR
jgi:hypothetical protein